MEVTKPNKNATAVTVFLWLFLLIGVVVVCFGGGIFVRSIQCNGWPIVAGVIRTSEIRKESGGKNGPTYSPHVSYDYTAAGSRFTCEKIAFGMMSSSSAFAQGYLIKYPVGKGVLVHYNPTDPSEAVLETGIHGGMWICFGVGTLFIVVASVFLKLIKPASIPMSPAKTVTQSKALQRLIGLIVIAMGASASIVACAAGSANIIPIAGVGVAFCIAGVYIMMYRPQPTTLSNILRIALVVIMLGVFNWIVFGMADRVVTPTVNTTKIDPFAASIILILDAAFLLVAIVALKKKLRNAIRL